MDKVMVEKYENPLTKDYVNEHVKRIKDVAAFLLSKCDNQGIEFDYRVEIMHYQAFNSYFLKLVFFPENDSSREVSLFTLRVFDKGDIDTPTTLDMFLVEKEEVDLKKIDCADDYKEDADLEEMTFTCYGSDDFKLKAHFLAKIAFEKMARGIKEKIESHESN